LSLGVFGGTFNPVHLGHLRAAEEVREALELDQVLFMPAKLPPHKPGSGIAPPDVRLDLVRRAVSGNPGFAVSDREVRRPGPSYSVDTLTELRSEAESGQRLWFLVGADAYREIHTWHRYAELFRLADVAVMRRPPDPGSGAPPIGLEREFEPTGAGFRHQSGRELRFVPVTLLDISSTAIRYALGQGKSVRYLVPDPVLAELERLAGQSPEWFTGSSS